MALAAFILSVTLMLPFLGWGIYTLRERYVLHEEIPYRVELATLGGVILFCVLQLALVKQWMGTISALYIFTALSLMVASTALFGPMLVSVAAQFVVDLVHPPQEDHSDIPHFTPAEALEEAGDYEGALQEYMVMARIFPRDAETAFRTGHALAELERYEEAAAALERGLPLLNDSARALMIINRLADLYARQLDRDADARRVLTKYLEQYPEARQASVVKSRLERMSASPVLAASDSTTGALELESPLGDPSE